MQIKIHQEGWIYFIVSSILTIIFFPFFPFIGMFFLVLSAYIFYFFRDPIRSINTDDNSKFLSPADGKIVSIKEISDPDMGDAFKIAIFLSFFNVHRQWVPINSKVLNTHYNLSCTLSD